jgi:hypothetical protein
MKKQARLKGIDSTTTCKRPTKSALLAMPNYCSKISMQKTWKEGHGIDTATGMYSMHEESSEN